MHSQLFPLSARAKGPEAPRADSGKTVRSTTGERPPGHGRAVNVLRGNENLVRSTEFFSDFLKFVSGQVNDHAENMST